MNTSKQEVYWYTLLNAETKTLDSNLACNILIIGGGIAGLTTAHSLIEKGIAPNDIVILEKDFCGGGASGKSSGFITPDSELEFADLVSKYGTDNAKRLWDYVIGGVEEIRRMIQKYNIECDYNVQDSFFIANTKKDFKEVEEEHDLLKKHYNTSELYKKQDIPKVLGSSDYEGAIRYSGTFGIISYLYCQALKNELVRLGVRVFEHASVEKIEKGKVQIKGTPVSESRVVMTEKIIVSVDHFMPSLNIEPKSSYHAQTFLTISKPLTDEEVLSIFPKDKLMVWDTDLIYQYYRITGENRLLFGAASLIYTYLPKTKKGSARYEWIIRKIHKYQMEKFGRLFEIEYIWPGLIGVSKDFLPIVGQHEVMKNVYYISGCAGLPWAAASGTYIADKIMGGRDELDQFFKAKRKFPVRDFIQTFITKPIAFAISHGLVKYFGR